LAALTTNSQDSDLTIPSVELGIGIIDKELRFVTVNRILAEINGISPQRHEGGQVREILGPVARAIEKPLESILENRYDSLTFTVTGKIPGRSCVNRWIGEYVPIRKQNGQVTAVGVLVMEVTSHPAIPNIVREVFHVPGDTQECIWLRLAVKRLERQFEDMIPGNESRRRSPLL
jgi:PAS domain-containing protein